VGHPAHIHMFKYAIKYFMDRNYDVKIVTRERENMMKPLMQFYNFYYEELYPNARGLIKKSVQMIRNDLKLLKICKRFNPDNFISVASPYSAHVSSILRKNHITFTDTEDATIILKLTVPFSDVVLTPECFLKDLPENKHVRYPGYHELAYLHPRWFRPDPTIFDLLGVSKDEPYVIMRFSAWDASHDIGQRGFRNMEERLQVIKKIENYAKVFISSEITLPQEFKEYMIKIPLHRIHDALYYASMYIGDGHKMAAESAILGTPSILVSTRYTKEGNFIELSKKYKLLVPLSEPYKALELGLHFIENISDMKKKWKRRVQTLLSDKIDVTSFMIDFIERYPQSHKDYKEHGDTLFDRFRGV
jgi:hypothetical protein